MLVVGGVLVGIGTANFDAFEPLDLLAQGGERAGVHGAPLNRHVVENVCSLADAIVAVGARCGSQSGWTVGPEP